MSRYDNQNSGLVEVADTNNNNIDGQPDSPAGASSYRRESLLPTMVGSICLTSVEADQVNELLRRPSFVPPARPENNMLAQRMGLSTTEGSNVDTSGVLPSPATSPDQEEADLDQLVTDVIDSRFYFPQMTFVYQEATARNKIMEAFVDSLACLFAPNACPSTEEFFSSSSNDNEDDQRPVSAFVSARPHVLRRKGKDKLVEDLVTMTEVINGLLLQVAELGGRYFVLEDALCSGLESACAFVKSQAEASSKQSNNNNNNNTAAAQSQDSAATKIQSLQRQRQARQELDKLKSSKAEQFAAEVRELDLEEEIKRTEIDNEESQTRGGVRRVMKMSSPSSTTDSDWQKQKRRDNGKESDDDAALNQAREEEATHQGNNSETVPITVDANDASQTNLSQDAAAVKIQSIQRQRAARSEYDRLRNEKASRLELLVRETELEEEIARSEIDNEESQTRGGVRRVMKMSSPSSTTDSDWQRQKKRDNGKESDDDTALNQAREEESTHQGNNANTVPVTVDANDASQTNLSQDAAAVKIQSIQRQRAARSEYDRLRNEKASRLELLVRETELEEEISRSEIDAEEGQNRGRTRLVMKMSSPASTTDSDWQKQKQQDNDQYQNQLQQEDENRIVEKATAEAARQKSPSPVNNTQQDEQNQNDAATKIQALQRQRQARQELESLRQERREQEAAATKIQALERQRKAKQEVDRLRQNRQEREEEDERNRQQQQNSDSDDKNRVLSYEEIQELASRHVKEQEDERIRLQQEAAREREEELRQLDEQSRERKRREAETRMNELTREEEEERRRRDYQTAESYTQQIQNEKDREIEEQQRIRQERDELEQRRKFREFQEEKRRKEAEEARAREEKEVARYNKHAKLDALDFDPFAEVHEAKKRRKQEEAERKRKEEEERRQQRLLAKLAKGENRSEQNRQRALPLNDNNNNNDNGDSDDDDQANIPVPPRQLSSALSPRPTRGRLQQQFQHLENENKRATANVPNRYSLAFSPGANPVADNTSTPSAALLQTPSKKLAPLPGTSNSLLQSASKSNPRSVASLISRIVEREIAESPAAMKQQIDGERSAIRLGLHHNLGGSQTARNLQIGSSSTPSSTLIPSPPSTSRTRGGEAPPQQHHPRHHQATLVGADDTHNHRITEHWDGNYSVRPSTKLPDIHRFDTQPKTRGFFQPLSTDSDEVFRKEVAKYKSGFDLSHAERERNHRAKQSISADQSQENSPVKN